jgi:hypothetical protein
VLRSNAKVRVLDAVLGASSTNGRGGLAGCGRWSAWPRPRRRRANTASPPRRGVGRPSRPDAAAGSARRPPSRSGTVPCPRPSTLRPGVMARRPARRPPVPGSTPPPSVSGAPVARAAAASHVKTAAGRARCVPVARARIGLERVRAVGTGGAVTCSDRQNDRADARQDSVSQSDRANPRGEIVRRLTWFLWILMVGWPAR